MDLESMDAETDEQDTEMMKLMDAEDEQPTETAKEDEDMPMQISASHWGRSGTCKITDDTFFSVFDGEKEKASSKVSLLEADIDTDTDTDTDSGFRLKDFLQGG